eukprot:1673238-Pyramimonas_sp.AAC.1
MTKPQIDLALGAPIRAVPLRTLLLVRHYRRQLHRVFPTIDCSTCFSVVDGDVVDGRAQCPTNSLVYLPIEKNRCETTLAVAIVTAVGADGVRYFRFQDPLVFALSTA